MYLPMFYLHAFIKSFYDIEWLRRQKKNGKQSATYVVLLILVLSIMFSVFALFHVNRIGGQLKTDILVQIPNFELHMEDAVLTVSELEQPFTFSFDEDVDSFLLYVDTVTTSTLTIEDIERAENQNVVLITQKEISIFDAQNGNTQVNDYKDIPNDTLTKTDIISWFDDLMNRKATIFAGLLVLIFVLLGVGKMIYLLILALIIYIVQQIAKKHYTFGELFTIGLFAITGPSIIVMLLRIFGYAIPYLYTILVLAYLLTIIFFKQDEIVVEKVEQAE